MTTDPLRPPLFLGLDVGTQSLRAALIDAHGRTVSFGVAPIETTYPRPGWAEQEPLAWWSAAGDAVRLALAHDDVHPGRIAGIGLDCTACTVVACDLAGQPHRPALLWMDQRAFHEADDISATGDPVLRYVSGRVSPEWMLPKALWLKRNLQELYHRSERIVECTDWMMFQLTGEWTLSLNHVAVKWNYARPDGGWPVGLLKRVGLDDLVTKWPTRIVPLGKGDARLSERAGRELGLPAGIPVAQGGIDAYLGMLGLGATQDGDVAVIVGSSTCHLAQLRQGVFGSGAAGCYPDATALGLYTIEAGQTATGSILDWYRRHFASKEQPWPKSAAFLFFKCSTSRPRPCLPAPRAWSFATTGRATARPTRTPRPAVRSRGCRWPTVPVISWRHLRSDGLRHASHPRRRECSRTRASSGSSWAAAAPSLPLWLQIHADILKKPVHLARESEACALGSAMAASVAAGIYPDFEQAATAMVAIERLVEPNPANAAVYDELFGNYVDLYRRLNG